MSDGALFITGGSGFIGREVLRLLRREGAGRVTCLTRRPAALAAEVPPLPEWQYLEGSLDEAPSYRAALPAGGTVLHLAAATGRAPAAEHRAVNVEGTRRLLECSGGSGVRRFVYVSSIAARFTDQRYYPYARSKAEAEALVRSSALDYVIVRPTMVLGPASPVLAGLRRLALAPLGVVFGDGHPRVQPIHVADLADLLLRVARETLPVEPRTVEAGGAEALPIGELIRKIRIRARGRPGPILHLPLTPLRDLLAAVEPVLGGILPLRAGQLASFVNDGTAALHPLTRWHAGRMRGVDEMLSSRDSHA